MNEIKRRLLNIAIGLDQFAWVLITLGNGSPDETISAALYRMDVHGKLSGRVFRPVVDLLFRPFEKNHCRESYLSEIRRSQLPRAYQVESANGN